MTPTYQSPYIVFTGKDQVELQCKEVSATPEAGQLLLRTRYSLISTGTETICLNRRFSPGTHWDRWVQYPFTTGYLSAGEVLQVGDGVEDFAPGDIVATRNGHSQYALCDAADVLPVPPGVSAEDAAWMGLGTIVQTGVRRAEHKLGDAVVVIGLGLLGQLAVQYAALGGAREVIAIDTAPARLEMARAHGATHGLEMSAGDAQEAVRDITQGCLADVVYDVTGHPAVFAPALSLAKRFGTLLLLGDAGSPEQQCLTSDVIGRGVKIVGAHDGHAPREESDLSWWTRPNMGRLFLTYLQRGQMRVNDLVTHRYTPQQAPEAYHMLGIERGTAMGVLFDWTGME